MELYESYLDEDINDERFSDAFDQDEDYDESGEDYDESGEDYDEDYDEARRKNRRRRRGRSTQNRRGRRNRLRTRNSRRSPQRQAAPVSTGKVQKAFENVGEDVNSLKTKLKSAENSQATALGVDILSAALLRPTIVEQDGKPVIKDNLVPLIITKVVGNQIGGGAKINLKRVAPWIIGALLLSPDSLKQLGISGLGDKPGRSATSKGIFGDIDTTTLLLLAALVYFAIGKK